MFGADKGNIDNEDQRLQGKGLRIGIVHARFNHDVTDALTSACKQELLILGVAERDIHHVSVPGALEVPVALQALAEKSKFDALTSACKQELLILGVAERDIHHVSVPGALEVPVALQALAEKTKFDALIAIGCIIRGETYHFELVANESSAGVTRIALDFQIPIANAILTTENLSQAIARQSVKGSDAARVAIEMANLLEKI